MSDLTPPSGGPLVRRLGCDELPDLTGERRPWCLILNTDHKDQHGTHWLAFYGPIAGRIELFDSFGFSPSTYNLDSRDPLHLSFTFQSRSNYVVCHYCIVYIYLRFLSHIINDIVYLLSKISNRD